MLDLLALWLPEDDSNRVAFHFSVHTVLACSGRLKLDHQDVTVVYSRTISLVVLFVPNSKCQIDFVRFQFLLTSDKCVFILG